MDGVAAALGREAAVALDSERADAEGAAEVRGWFDAL